MMTKPTKRYLSTDEFMRAVGRSEPRIYEALRSLDRQGEPVRRYRRAHDMRQRLYDASEVERVRAEVDRQSGALVLDTDLGVLRSNAQGRDDDEVIPDEDN